MNEIKEGDVVDVKFATRTRRAIVSKLGLGDPVFRGKQTLWATLNFGCYEYGFIVASRCIPVTDEQNSFAL